MTDFEKLEFVDCWLAEVGPALRELRGHPALLQPTEFEDGCLRSTRFPRRKV
jgi:hypothetical protein